MFVSSTAIWITSSDTGSVASRARSQLIRSYAIWVTGSDTGSVASRARTELTSSKSHCDFSSNLFHGQIAQIQIDQLSDPENCSPWKVFGKNHPQIKPL